MLICPVTLCLSFLVSPKREYTANSGVSPSSHRQPPRKGNEEGGKVHLIASGQLSAVGRLHARDDRFVSYLPIEATQDGYCIQYSFDASQYVEREKN